jgi:hypothetical protein
MPLLATFPLGLHLLQAYLPGGGLSFLEIIIYLLHFAVIWLIIVKLVNDIAPTNHWQHHFDTLHFSSQEFYKTLETAITQKEMPQLKISRVALYEAGIGSAQREYLRIERKHLLFDVCAAPFGHGFFISWWQAERKHFIRLLVAAIPFIGKYLERAFFPITYYRIDTEEMFTQSIHTLVLNIVDEITKDKGIRGLTELERKPVEAKR